MISYYLFNQVIEFKTLSTSKKYYDNFMFYYNVHMNVDFDFVQLQIYSIIKVSTHIVEL